MGRVDGPLGSKLRGKIGEVVAFRTVGGGVALRAYQPIVKNPKTLRQRVSRNKMSAASALSALLSTPIKVGYAAAVAGEKMYARNMFISDTVPTSSGVMTISGEDVTVDITKIKIAKACGLTVVPAGQLDGAIGGGLSFVPTNTAEVELNPGDSLGVCLAAVDYAAGKCIYKQGVATTGVTLSANEVASLSTPVYFAFYKVIPEALNGVPTETEPWKYPSSTSDSVQVFYANVIVSAITPSYIRVVTDEAVAFGFEISGAGFNAWPENILGVVAIDNDAPQQYAGSADGRFLLSQVSRTDTKVILQGGAYVQVKRSYYLGCIKDLGGNVIWVNETRPLP